MTDKAELIEWVRQAQTGDRSAFEQVMLRTQPLARRIAYTIVPRDQLEDAIQESYLLVFRKLPTLQKPEAFIGWLSRLVLHVCYRMASKVTSDEELTERSAASEQTDQLVDALVLRQAMGRLQQKDRDVLILREILGLSYEEVSYSLRVPLGTVRSRLSSARKRLAQMLKTL